MIRHLRKWERAAAERQVQQKHRNAASRSDAASRLVRGIVLCNDIFPPGFGPTPSSKKQTARTSRGRPGHGRIGLALPLLQHLAWDDLVGQVYLRHPRSGLAPSERGVRTAAKRALFVIPGLRPKKRRPVAAACSAKLAGLVFCCPLLPPKKFSKGNPRTADLQPGTSRAWRLPRTRRAG